MPQLSPQFLAFIKQSKKAAKYMAAIIKEYRAIHGELPGQSPSEDQPRQWSEGGQHELQTPSVQISDAELDAIHEEAAEAAVIDRFVEYLKGFAAGVMLA